MAEPGAMYMAALDAWREKANGGMVALARQSIYDICVNVVLDTPVDTGFLRGGWQPNIGGILDALGKGSQGFDKGGAMATAAVGLKMVDLEVGDTFYMTNRTAYALRLEFGFVGEDSLGRHYNQAGRYYVTNNVARWQLVVEHRAKQIWG